MKITTSDFTFSLLHIFYNDFVHAKVHELSLFYINIKVTFNQLDI